MMKRTFTHLLGNNATFATFLALVLCDVLGGLYCIASGRYLHGLSWLLKTFGPFALLVFLLFVPTLLIGLSACLAPAVAAGAARLADRAGRRMTMQSGDRVPKDEVVPAQAPHGRGDEPSMS